MRANRGKRLMAYLLAVPLLLYLAILGALYFGQDSMLFPTGQVAPPAPVPARAERLALDAASGERLVGLHVPPARRRGERLLILGFGGNAADAGATAALLHDLYPAADIVTFYYRGYRPSGGRPSAAALRADALLIHDHMVASLRPSRTIAAGFSVGGGIAAALSAERALDGLILVTPFDSLGRVAADHYPWLPVRLLFRNRLDPIEDLRRRPTPVAILAAGRDRIVPGRRTQALRLATPILAFDRVIEEAGHNDIYERAEFESAMREALRRILARPRPLRTCRGCP